MNRCGASVKDACRYPCEEVRLSSPTSPRLPCVYAPLLTSILLQVCEYKDTDLFSGFKPTGSAKPCDGEPEEPEAPEEPGGRR